MRRGRQGTLSRSAGWRALTRPRHGRSACGACDPLNGTSRARSSARWTGSSDAFDAEHTTVNLAGLARSTGLPSRRCTGWSAPSSTTGMLERENGQLPARAAAVRAGPARAPPACVPGRGAAVHGGPLRGDARDRASRRAGRRRDPLRREDHRPSCRSARRRGSRAGCRCTARRSARRSSRSRRPTLLDQVIGAGLVAAYAVHDRDAAAGPRRASPRSARAGVAFDREEASARARLRGRARLRSERSGSSARCRSAVPRVGSNRIGWPRR